MLYRITAIAYAMQTNAQLNFENAGGDAAANMQAITQLAHEIAATSHNVFFINDEPMVQTAFLNNFIKEVREAAMLAQQDFDLSEIAAQITFAVEGDPHYRYYDEIMNLIENGVDLSQEAHDALFGFYMDRGEVPYGVAKARDGDPYEWISARVAEYMGAE